MILIRTNPELKALLDDLVQLQWSGVPLFIDESIARYVSSGTSTHSSTGWPRTAAFGL